MRSIKPFLFCLVIFLMPGCSIQPTGNKAVSDPTYISQIQPHQTTKGRVLELLGQPEHIMPNDASETWVYVYLEGTTNAEDYVPFVGLFKKASMNMEYSEFLIVMGDDGIVKKVSYFQRNCEMTAGETFRNC